MSIPLGTIFFNTSYNAEAIYNILPNPEYPIIASISKSAITIFSSYTLDELFILKYESFEIDKAPMNCCWRSDGKKLVINKENEIIIFTLNEIEETRMVNYLLGWDSTPKIIYELRLTETFPVTESYQAICFAVSLPRIIIGTQSGEILQYLWNGRLVNKTKLSESGISQLDVEDSFEYLFFLTENKNLSILFKKEDGETEIALNGVTQKFNIQLVKENVDYYSVDMQYLSLHTIIGGELLIELYYLTDEFEKVEFYSMPINTLNNKNICVTSISFNHDHSLFSITFYDYNFFIMTPLGDIVYKTSISGAENGNYGIWKDNMFYLLNVSEILLINFASYEILYNFSNVKY